MKKLSFVLALVMALTCLVICPVSAADEGTVFVFDFEELPFSKGKNGDCFFPNPERVKDAAFPEIYTWNSCTLSPDAGFVRVDVGGSPMLEFDSMPASYVINKEMPYLMVVIKADRAAENVKFNIVSQGNKYKRTYTTSLTGGWQKLVFDLTGADGWQIKGEDGKYTAHNGAAYTEGGYGGGGFRFDMPGNAFVTNLTIDAMGFFKTEDAAKAYTARATVENTETVKFGGASAPSTGTTTPATPVAPAEPEWEASIFNALKKDEPENNTAADDFSSVVPYGLNISENMVTLKFQNLVAGEKGAYSTGIEKSKVINTWGSIKNLSVNNGITKIELGSGNIFEITTFGGGVTAGTFPYWIVAYRSEKNATGTSNGYVYSASNKYRTRFPMICDGEWHYDVVKMDDVSKIEVKGDSGYAADSSINPAEVGYGALRIDFPKYGADAVFYLDYLAFFKSEEEAKAFADKSIEALGKADEKEEAPAEETGFSYIKGYTDGTFGPNKNMTRAEAITVIARLVGKEDMINKERTSEFTDIKAGDWYFNAIAFLESLGMLENYEGKIEPNKNITRAEFIKLAYEAGAFEYSNKRPDFPDLQPSHPYYKELCLGYAAGAITGFNDGTLGPDKEITRAQIVTIINRILGIEDSKADATFSDIDGHWAKGAIMSAVGK